jgi:hypothetical protein
VGFLLMDGQLRLLLNTATTISIMTLLRNVLVEDIITVLPIFKPGLRLAQKPTDGIKADKIYNRQKLKLN